MHDLRPLKQDFIGFLVRSFATLHPARTLELNWHLELIAAHLAAIERGEITRLIINVPPRSLKSIMVSVAWPAWLLGRDPSRQILCASYAQTLATKHSLDCRSVMQSEWYQRVFPATQLSRSQNEKHKFMTTQHGMRMATSIWGSATGEGGDVLIADDPINPLQAQSRLMRGFVNDWFDHTFSTRLNDKHRGAIVLVMQRLHAEDVSGHALAKGGWEWLRLPAIADAPEVWQLAEGEYRREVGELLHPAREDARLLERAQRELGSTHFAAQYQQAPLRETGAMVKRDWFVRF